MDAEGNVLTALFGNGASPDKLIPFPLGRGRSGRLPGRQWQASSRDLWTLSVNFPLVTRLEPLQERLSGPPNPILLLRSVP